jgi:hypothetical protein
MPKTAIDYSKACIYKIVCNDLEITECYVGSTTSFSRRKATHKSACNNENNKDHNLNVYQFIRDHGGWNNWCMIKIEDHECKDGNDLKARERYWVEELKAGLNKQIPTRTKTEYYIDNKDEIRERKKQWYQDNKDELREKHKQYRIDNADKIKEHKNEKNTCDCGGKYTRSHKAQHVKSIRHQIFIQTI